MPPSDDLRDSSALRQEGPQQDMWLVFEERSALWWGPRSCGYTDLLRAGLYSEEDAKRIANNPSRRDRAVRLADKLREIEQLEHGNERVLAALSASRTAQAPQQEGLDLVTRLIDYRGQVLNGFRHISRFEEADLIQAAIDSLRPHVAPAEGEQ